MPQRVEFEHLPGTRYDQYIFKTRNVLNFLAQPDGTKFRSFRDFVRKQGIWDKEKSPGLFSLLDVKWDKKTVQVGRLAKQLQKVTSDTEWQDILYAHLKEQNILLVKYVFEALDVDAGGRLHSVHELYRMITSYVYPGEYVTLPNFQAWIDWMAATGYIKLVGIRWALSERGLKELIELKSMDIEEILEDLEEEAEEEGEDDPFADDDDDDDEPAVSASTTADIDDDEDLFADLPPEPSPPSQADLAAAAAAFSDEFGDLPGADDDDPFADDAPAPKPAAKRRAAPRSAAKAGRAAAPAAPTAVAAGASGIHAPLPLTAWPTVATVDPDDPDTSALANRISGYHMVLGNWPSYDAERLGVTYNAEGNDLTLLIELATLAVLIEGLSPQPQVFAFVTRLRNTTFFATLGYGEGLEEGLDAMERTGHEAWARQLFERLVHARFIARRASAKLDLLPSLRGATNGRQVVELLREHLLGPHYVEAPFWVARELVRLGVLEDAKLASAVAVPTRRLRENAARIGLIPSPDIRTFDALLALSEQVTKLFGAQAGYGAALEQLDRALGLTLDS